MLILTRRAGESITIGDDIVVTVVEVSGSQVRVGISAPREVRVLREEIQKQIQEENRAAARGISHQRTLEDVCRQWHGNSREGSGE